MDRKTIVAIVLCVAVLVLYRPLLQKAGLSHYLEAPRPTPIARVDSSARSTAPPEKTAALGANVRPVAPDSGASLIAAPGVHLPAAGMERNIQLETPLYRATFSTRGARLLSIEVKRYASAHGLSSVDGHAVHARRGEPVGPGDRVVLGGGPLFAVDLGSGETLRSLAELTYEAAESLDASGQKVGITFTARDPSGVEVRQTYRARPDNYALDLAVALHGVPESWRITDYSLTTRSWPLVTEADSLADSRGLRASSLVGTNLHKEHAGGLLRGAKRFDGNVLWAATQSRYFVAAVAVASGPARAVVSTAEREVIPGGSPSKPATHDLVTNALVVGLPSGAGSVHRYVLYAGPCEYFRLASLGFELRRCVDLGWNWILPVSRALLQLLNWLYGVFRNYGVAILALATLVRLLLHPLNMMSMKSMRAMQKLQPELERIREKYKNDAQAMNTAVMGLYKENKVNPAGGCLPMVLQMPLFIALYQVLFNAIELRQAPFVAWIDDLSAPDHLFSVAGFPLRLLPILMLGSGLLAQLVTPTDPRQRGSMYMMNVIMLVFFYNLPSGLVLYWTIMNVLTALQQWLVLRQDGPISQAVPVPAVAPSPKRRRTAGS